MRIATIACIGGALLTLGACAELLAPYDVGPAIKRYMDSAHLPAATGVQCQPRALEGWLWCDLFPPEPAEPIAIECPVARSVRHLNCQKRS